ncbi:MAG: thiamine pyrophosphate-binding protein [Alphaproteobacteria bacterium]|nr:thiamine pyrophosphate-binding protein [Alphaproteobacteria bacterium]
MNEKTVAEHMVDFLENRGVKHIFGLCGHTNIAVLSAIAKSNSANRMEFITVRHEQIASHAADAYARVTGKPSVVLSHLSPGLTNCATGVANAALDCIPMVVIAGDIPTHYYGKHPHQEVNLHADAQQYEIYRPFVKRAWRVDSAILMAEILEKAFHLAQSGQPGPVLVNVPMDIFSQKIASDSFDLVKQNTRQLIKPSIDEATASNIITKLAEAKKPLIYAGGGILSARASEELRIFAEHFQLPIAHSLMGKGAVSDANPLVLGMTGFWGTRLVNQACLNADWIFAIGTRFKEADCSSWYPGYTFNVPNSKIIHIDIEASEIGRNYPTEIGAIADAKAALSVLIKIAQRDYPNGIKREKTVKAIRDFKQNFKAENKKMACSDAFPMMPERILADTRIALPDDAIITTDVGWNKNGVGQQFDILTPGSILTPGGFATMGFGPPAAIGAKIAQPERVVISLVGDGGFGQNPAMLATAVERNLGIIWIVMNNNAFGTIAGLQKAHYDITYGTVFSGEAGAPEFGPDYAKLAESYGAVGVKITKADEFLPALQAAIKSDKPTVIDVAMINNPTPTTGHWNILDIYSPDKKASHVAT